MNLVARANALAAQLNGRTPTSCCPGCFTDLAELLQDASAREMDVVRADCHSFWDACVAVILEAQSEEEFTTLRVALDDHTASCRRGHADDADDEQTDAEVVRDFVETACLCLQLVLGGQGDCASERAENSRKPFATRRGFWPSSSVQLFPDGALPTLAALARWGIIITTMHPVVVLVTITRIALPFVLDALEESADFRESLVKLIIDRLRGRDAAERAEVLVPRSSAWVARLHGIGGVSLLLHTFYWGPDSGGADLLSVFRSHEADVFSAVLDGFVFVNGLGADVPQDTYKGLASTANLLQQLLKRPVDVLPARALELRDPPMELPDIMSLFVALLDLKCRRRCAGPGCGLFAHNVAPDAVFKRCAGCEKLCYCSDECQRRDWTQDADGRVPHKNVCATLRKVSEGGPVRALSDAQWKDALDFMMAHNALPWALRERAAELRRPRVMVTFFAVGPGGAMHWNTFPEM